MRTNERYKGTTVSTTTACWWGVAAAIQALHAFAAFRANSKVVRVAMRCVCVIQCVWQDATQLRCVSTYHVSVNFEGLHFWRVFLETFAKTRRESEGRCGGWRKELLVFENVFLRKYIFFKSFNKKFNDFYLKTIKSLKIYKTKPEVNNKISKN